MLSELTYQSKNPKQALKQREVGMLLLGRFCDDISMYAMRNPSFNLMTLVGTVLSLSTDSKKFKTFQSLLLGRMFSASTQIADLIDARSEQTGLFIRKLITQAL